MNYITHASYEHPGIAVVQHESGSVLTVGPEGLQVFTTRTDYLTGLPPEYADDPGDLPADGWEPINTTDTHDDVQILTCANGYRVTVDGESAVLWPPLAWEAFREAFNERFESALAFTHL